MSLCLTLEAARLVRAPRQLVWRVFSDLTSWPEWNPLARGQAPGPSLEPGALLDLWLKPLGLPMMVRAQVLEAIPAQGVGWRGSAWGITSQQNYTFSDHGAHTLVGFKEMLSGWPLLLARPLYSPRALSQQAQAWLGALAREAERLARGAVGGSLAV